MNAMTGPDWTMYPFATTNRQDFKNLMSVYLDATLRPLLKKTDFVQEGWRIGPQTNQSPGSTPEPKPDRSLEFKGVVYNEMKGAMSDANGLYYTRFQDHIFPEIHNSGGDPQKMTNLTYDQLKSFHKHNYHPSNAKVFSYGNMPLGDHLTEVDRQFRQFPRSSPDLDIKTPISLDGPQTVTVDGPIDPLVEKNMQHKVSTSWILGDMSDVHKAFALNILSSLLLNGYGSPLYRALIESELGPDFSPNTGLDNAGKTGMFSVGLNGVKAEDVLRVKEATVQALREAHERGFEDQKVQGLLHQLELGLKDRSANFGMSLMQRLQPGWFNGNDPFDALAVNETVSRFKENYAKGGYLEGLLQTYLLNDRTFTFIMKPSSSFEADLATEERARLDKKLQGLFEKTGNRSQTETGLVQEEEQLLEIHNASKDHDLSCLPKLNASDIPRTTEKKEVRDSRIGAAQVQWRETNTNGLTYFRAISSLDGIPEELRQLMPLFCDALFRLGTRDKSMEELEDMIKLKTGGIRVSYHSTSSPHDPTAYSEGISLSGLAMDTNVPAMYELLQTILQDTNFDGPEVQAMIRELLNAETNNTLSSAANSGHSYCRRFAQASLSPAAAISEQTSGLTQLRFVASLASSDAEGGLNDVISKLKTIQSFAVADSGRLRIALTCGFESVEGNKKALRNFLSNLPKTADFSHEKLSLQDYNRSAKTFFPLPYQVYHSALVVPTVGYTDPASAHLAVLSQLVTNKYMHPEVREKGGAYGGGAYSSGTGAVFGFYSYRDPNPQNTLRVVSNLGDWLSEQKWGEQELEEAKLSVFQGLDAPESVSEEGMTRFLVGIDEAMERKKREQILDTTIDDVMNAAQKHVVGGMKNSKVAVMGPPKEGLFEGDGWVVENMQPA